MPPLSLPALRSGEPTAWEEAVYAFLVEKRSRSGSTRTVESYARMLWPFFRVTTPDRVRSADDLAYAHGIGLSGRVPSSATVGARIACLSSFYRFAIRMGLVVGNLCDTRRDGLLQLPGQGWQARSTGTPPPCLRGDRPDPRDVGQDLATMDPATSLWQAEVGPRGITSGTSYARFRRYLRAAGLTPTGLHILRHTAARLRRDAGASIEAVPSFLDHSSLAVTSVYLRRLEGETDRTSPDVAVAIGVWLLTPSTVRRATRASPPSRRQHRDPRSNGATARSAE